MTTESSPRRVLIIDDDPMSLELLEMLLTVEGYTVESAHSGDAALALLASNEARPDVVLSDIQMPGTTGAALAAALRTACGPHTLLIAMSGSDAPEAALRALDGFLSKPFTAADLVAAVEGRANRIDLAAAAEPAPNPSSGPALDETIYTRLAASMQPAQLHELYAMCLNDARQRIAGMRRVASGGDDDAFIRQAHAIKGSAGMLGAKEIYSLAADLESGGIGSMIAINPLDELAAACDRLERILGARAV